MAGGATGVFTKKGTGNSPVTGSSSNSPTAGVDFDGSHDHNISGNTGDQGGTMGQSFDIRPPYYALCYIMKSRSMGGRSDQPKLKLDLVQ